ncbi:MAG: DUF4019 domain-containing protein [Gammaproteobacteria bacterium]|nr:DUF4019 domain-containing protein [Gammaproteobacteria bacterium]
MRPMTRLLAAAALLACGWLQPAIAQTLEPDPTDLVRGGLQVVQMIDLDKTGELWDGAAAATRKRVARDDFTGQVAKARAALGAPRQRTWYAINRQFIADGDADLKGQFVNIEYETRFSNDANTTRRELVTFHLDSDRVWRFSGYVIR